MGSYIRAMHEAGSMGWGRSERMKNEGSNTQSLHRRTRTLVDRPPGLGNCLLGKLSSLERRKLIKNLGSRRRHGGGRKNPENASRGSTPDRHSGKGGGNDSQW